MLEILIDDEDDQSTNKASVDAALKCNICEKLLEIPRSTRCKHTFCMKCIKEWIEKNNKLCPTCAKPVCLTDLTKASREIRTTLRQLKREYREGEGTKRKKRAAKNQTTQECSQTRINCPAASVNCLWRGNQNQLDIHLERCPYNILQPILKDMMLHKDLLTKQVDQYKNRIKKLETEVLEMDKKIIDLEEVCNDYKEQIEQLKNQKQGNRILYIIP